MLIQMADEAYPQLSAGGKRVEIHVSEDHVVRGDPDKLARAFNNILKNAAQYSYPNTEIVISAKADTDKIVIIFENHGATIPPDQLSSIFDKFNRLDDARKSDTGGAGLGLSIAEEIIHLHGGEISVHSENDTVHL
ncbi:Adaptive-response sensory-kinase SasA [bioreactor metagenome]|uniref:histidine kinase n=1 Tax=bioreactor metagenome TaxID=1076179 RepID=A0A645I447_9ZZZZ